MIRVCACAALRVPLRKAEEIVNAYIKMHGKEPKEEDLMEEEAESGDEEEDSSDEEEEEGQAAPAPVPAPVPAAAAPAPAGVDTAAVAEAVRAAAQQMGHGV